MFYICFIVQLIQYRAAKIHNYITVTDND